MFRLLYDFFKSLRYYAHFSILNILGMAVAFLSAYIILLQVNFNLTYNQTLVEADRTFRIEFKNSSMDVMSYPYFATLTDPLGYMFGEDENVESFGRMNFYSTPLNLRSYDENEPWSAQALESWGTWQSAQTMGFKLLSGDFSRLEELNTIVLNESFCKTHNIEVDDILFDGRRMLTVVGVFEDFPRNCMFNGLNMFIGDPPLLNDKVNANYNYFYRLYDKNQKEIFIDNCYRKYATVSLSNSMLGENSIDSLVTCMKQRGDIRLTPLSEIYTTNDVFGCFNTTTNIDTCYLLLAVAIIIIVIAFVNYFNFNMAMVPRRIRRVNIERIFGASLMRLRASLLFEAVGIVLLSMTLALVVVALSAAEIDSYDIFDLSVDPLSNMQFIIHYTFFVLLLAVATAIYPVYYMTSSPSTFKVNTSFIGSKGVRVMRNALLCLQFAISMILIVFTIFIRLQYDYMMNFDMGYNKQHLFSMDVPGVKISYDDRMNLYDALVANPLIEDATFSVGRFVQEMRMTWTRDVYGDDKTIKFPVYPVSWNFLKFMGIEVYEGRDFAPSDELSVNGAIILNRTLQEANGITMDDRFVGHTNEPVPIIGFCEDVIHRPLYSPAGAFAFYLFGPNPWQNINNIYIRTTPGADVKVVADFVRQKVAEMYPMITPSDMYVAMYDDEIKMLYSSEQTMMMILTIFSFISIIISLLGVFGLVLLETQYRRREIALRRVNGATEGNVMYMLVVQYLKVVAIGFMFALPISYIIVKLWLQMFAYRVPIHWFVFVVAILLVASVTSFVVFVTAWRTVRSNPVDVLRGN